MADGVRVKRPPKLDGPSAETEAWLRAWDKAPRPTRDRMLRTFARAHAGASVAELERGLGSCASLVLARLLSAFARARAPAPREHVAAVLVAIGVFIHADGADRARAQLVATGALAPCVALLALAAEFDEPPTPTPTPPAELAAQCEVLALLQTIATHSAEHRAALHALSLPAVLCALLAACADERALSRCGALLSALCAQEAHAETRAHGEAPPSHRQLSPEGWTAVLAGLLPLVLQRRNGCAQLHGARALRSVLCDRLPRATLYRAGLGAARVERALAEAPAAEQPRLAALLMPQPGGADVDADADDGAADGAAEAAARAHALRADCALGPEAVYGAVSLLRARAERLQREGICLCMLLSEHESLHGLLNFQITSALLAATELHTQAVLAQLVAQALVLADGRDSDALLQLAADGDEPHGAAAALLAREGRLCARGREARAAFARTLVEADAVALVCALLVHARSAECPRQAAASLQLIARHGPPAACAQVRRYAAPVYDQLVADPVALTAMPLEPGAREELHILLGGYLERGRRAQLALDSHSRA